MTRGRKPRPGRITFVGSGPGDPGLLTARAATVLANAALVFTDPDVPEPVLALIGRDLPPISGPAPAGPAARKGDAAGGDGDQPRRYRAAPTSARRWASPPKSPRRSPPRPGPAPTWCGWWPVTR